MKATFTLAGCWRSRYVTMDGRELHPGRSRHVVNHSPDGLSWGYEGSGPAQLALAALLRLMAEWEAVAEHQRFTREVIARLPQADFVADVIVSREGGGKYEYAISLGVGGRECLTSRAQPI